MNQSGVKMAVIENMRKHMADFGISELELIERVSVVLDQDQFNYKEDESVWMQKRDKAPKVCEVYFDDVWLCDLYETDPHEFLVTKFLKGFLAGYESKKIRLNRFLAELEFEQKKIAEKQKQDAVIKSMPTSTPEEKAAKEIVTELIKEKNEKKPS